MMAPCEVCGNVFPAKWVVSTKQGKKVLRCNIHSIPNKEDIILNKKVPYNFEITDTALLCNVPRKLRGLKYDETLAKF